MKRLDRNWCQNEDNRLEIIIIIIRHNTSRHSSANGQQNEKKPQHKKILMRRRQNICLSYLQFRLPKKNKTNFIQKKKKKKRARRAFSVDLLTQQMRQSTWVVCFCTSCTVDTNDWMYIVYDDVAQYEWSHGIHRQTHNRFIRTHCTTACVWEALLKLWQKPNSNK